MSEIFYVYVIVNTVNGKLYIGKTNNPKRRWIIHRNYANKISNAARYNYPIYKGMRKYGLDNFQFEVIEACQNEYEALQSEIDWISYLRYMSIPLYNITDGGQGTSGRRHSPMTKNKISQSNKGKKNRLGKTNSSEHKSAISTANLKLTEQQVREIKLLLKNGLSTRRIAKLFHISKTSIQNIKSGKYWSHISV